jgi:hypothetical protein
MNDPLTPFSTLLFNALARGQYLSICFCPRILGAPPGVIQRRSSSSLPAGNVTLATCTDRRSHSVCRTCSCLRLDSNPIALPRNGFAQLVLSAVLTSSS